MLADRKEMLWTIRRAPRVLTVRLNGPDIRGQGISQQTLRRRLRERRRLRDGTRLFKGHANWKSVTVSYRQGKEEQRERIGLWNSG